MIKGGRWIYVVLVGIVVCSAFPLYWSVVVSSRDTSAIGSYPPPLVPGGSLWDNLSKAFEQGNFGLALALGIILLLLALMVNVGLQALQGRGGAGGSGARGPGRA